AASMIYYSSINLTGGLTPEQIIFNSMSGFDIGGMNTINGTLLGAGWCTLSNSSTLNGAAYCSEVGMYEGSDVNFHPFNGIDQVPEPSTWALLGTGVAVLAFLRRRKASPR
ncbi:MAG: PEP-CTERM sorting domain-containing protein, partial [bacterium]|nr:PEP-CTERM sorting domain-containing protein [bacterium]